MMMMMIMIMMIIIIIIPRDMVCLGNICINTLQKGAKDDDDNNNMKHCILCYLHWTEMKFKAFINLIRMREDRFCHSSQRERYLCVCVCVCKVCMHVCIQNMYDYYLTLNIIYTYNNNTKTSSPFSLTGQCESIV
jgi:hypothetical protein